MLRRKFLRGAALAPLSLAAAPLASLASADTAVRPPVVADKYMNVIAGDVGVAKAGMGAALSGDVGYPYKPEEWFAEATPESGSVGAVLRRTLERRFWETFDLEVRASPFLSLFTIRGATMDEMRAMQPGMKNVGGRPVYFDGECEMKVYGEWLERDIGDDLYPAADYLARRMVARIGHELGHAVTRARYKVRLLEKSLRKVTVASDEGHVIGYACNERGVNGVCWPAWEEEGRPAWLPKVPNLMFGPTEVALDDEGKAGEYRILPNVNSTVTVHVGVYAEPRMESYVGPGRVRVYATHNGMAVTALDR